jgi:phosphoenolpyruvate carboxykinase (GTP)
VLAWIFRRCDGEADAEETVMGLVPTPGALDTDGLDISEDALTELLKADPEDWSAQLPQMREHYAMFGDALPDELRGQLDALERRLEKSS